MVLTEYDAVESVFLTFDSDVKSGVGVEVYGSFYGQTP